MAFLALEDAARTALSTIAMGEDTSQASSVSKLPQPGKLSFGY
jgi:hypothetical protein